MTMDVAQHETCLFCHRPIPQSSRGPTICAMQRLVVDYLGINSLLAFDWSFTIGVRCDASNTTWS
jgi:hypothetical protein